MLQKIVLKKVPNFDLPVCVHALVSYVMLMMCSSMSATPTTHLLHTMLG